MSVDWMWDDYIAIIILGGFVCLGILVLLFTVLHDD